MGEAYGRRVEKAQLGSIMLVSTIRREKVGLNMKSKDHTAIAGKEDKNKKIKSKSNEPSTAEPAS